MNRPAREGQPPSGERLPREERLHRRGDFQRVFDQGARAGGRFMTLVVMANGQAVARLGVAAGRRVGNAVRRNRARRLVREIVRRHKPAPGYDVIVIPRPEVLDADFPALEADYCATLRRRTRR
jgi:ribonuclease P protein component